MKIQKIICEDTVMHEKNGPRQKYKTDDRISHDAEAKTLFIYRQEYHLLFILMNAL